MKTKQEYLALVETHQNQLLTLISDLIKIPNENPTGTQQDAIAYVMNYLEKEQIAYEKTGANPDFPCILAKYGQDEGFSLIFNGHVDVVPAGDRNQWQFDPYCGTITDTQILGRGTSDMKAGLAGFLFATALFAREKEPIKGNIRLHIVSDEESGGQYGSQWLCENGYAAGADACLVAEPTTMETIEIGQKGGLLLKLKAYGKSAHGSLGNYKGENAILKLGKVLALIHRLTEVKGHFTERQQKPLYDSKILAEEKNGIPGVGNAIDHVTANVGVISGGTRHNMVPDYCEAVVDVRLPIGVIKEDIQTCLDQILADSQVSGVEYELNYKSDANFTDYEADIVLAVKKNAEELRGKEVIPAYQWASSDAREYRKQNIPTIQFGPSNTVGIHAYNETVEIGDVMMATKTYVAAICDLMGIK